jgi:hypothetical protein
MYNNSNGLARKATVWTTDHEAHLFRHFLDVFKTLSGNAVLLENPQFDISVT